jgi:hypothetical protein
MKMVVWQQCYSIQTVRSSHLPDGLEFKNGSRAAGFHRARYNTRSMPGLSGCAPHGVAGDGAITQPEVDLPLPPSELRLRRYWSYTNTRKINWWLPAPR